MQLNQKSKSYQRDLTQWCCATRYIFYSLTRKNDKPERKNANIRALAEAEELRRRRGATYVATNVSFKTNSMKKKLIASIGSPPTKDY